MISLTAANVWPGSDSAMLNMFPYLVTMAIPAFRNLLDKKTAEWKRDFEGEAQAYMTHKFLEVVMYSIYLAVSIRTIIPFDISMVYLLMLYRLHGCYKNL